MIFRNIQLFNPEILIFMGMSLLLNGLIAYLWHKKIYQKLGLKTYQAIQRIHLNETPRLGGFVFILSLASFAWYCNINESIFFIKLILLCLIPIFIIGLMEDLFHNVSAKLRLICILFTAYLFVSNVPVSLPNLDNITLVSKFVLVPGGFSLFYIISMAAITNGMNMIDGVNGLCAVVALAILGTFIFLSYKTGDAIMLLTNFYIILILVPFLVFNYPNGKIFLGDSGAYSLGLIASMLSIIFFGRHPEISPWSAVLILIYPAIEVIFTLCRRLLYSQKHFQPDRLHIHNKLFDILSQKSGYKKNPNLFVMPFLLILYVLPAVLTITFYSEPFYIKLSIVCYISLYTGIYLKFSKL